MADAGRGAKALHGALTKFQQGQDAASVAAALALAQEALEEFTSAQDRTGAAAACQLMGILHVSAGRFDEALGCIDAAIPLRESTGDREGVAALLQERFELCLRVGDLAGARAAMERQIQAQELAGDREGKAHAMHQLAQLLIQQGGEQQEAVAEALVQEAIFAMEAPGMERARSALHLLYSGLWARRGEAARAIQHAQIGLDLGKQAKFRPAEVDAQQQLGAVLLMAGQARQARRVLEDALVGRELLKDVEGRFQVLRELSAAELALGEVESGLGRLEAAARGAEQAGHLVGAITALQLLQVAADEQDRPEQAHAAARRLVGLARRHGEAEAVAAALFSLGTRHAARSELAEAEAAFSEALQIQQGLGLVHEAAVSGGMLGQIEVAQGRREAGVRRLIESLAALEQAGSEAAASVREILSEIQDGEDEG